MAIKVSQATIDKIKKMGMSAALKSAPKANAEMTEGIRRMYGQRRLTAAVAKAKPPAAPKPTDSRFSGVKKAAPKPTDSRFSGTKSTTAKKAVAPTKKKTGTTDPFAKFVFGVGRAAKEPFTSKTKKNK